ncbi:MAG TPA: hypothetical protein ENL18_04065 [Thermoplasmatales archaeon]|nr:hypothetical protein [Thermoplasmatales archaeon]
MKSIIIILISFLMICPLIVNATDKISADDYYLELPEKYSEIDYVFHSVPLSGFEELDDMERGIWYRHHENGVSGDDFDYQDQLIYLFKLNEAYYLIMVIYQDNELYRVGFMESPITDVDFIETEYIPKQVTDASLKELGVIENDSPSFMIIGVTSAMAIVYFIKKKFRGIE